MAKVIIVKTNGEQEVKEFANVMDAFSYQAKFVKKKDIASAEVKM